MKKLFIPLALVALIGGGCVEINTTNNYISPTSSLATRQPEETSISYFVSNDESTKYCNGSDMDSAGYKKSLTNKMTAAVPGKLSTLDTIKTTLTKAANASDFKGSSNLHIEKTTFANGVVTLHPAGGWAGVSIFMCAWPPFVEKQLEQFPEVKQIKWEPES